MPEEAAGACPDVRLLGTVPETLPEQTNSTNGKKLTTGASNDRPQKRVKEGEEVACEESHYIRQGAATVYSLWHQQ